MSESSSEPEIVGIFQALPVHLREGTRIEGMNVSLLPWGAPGIYALYGFTPPPQEEPLLVLAYEWPMPWLRPTTRLEKSEVESIHLARYSTDCLLATGVRPFSAPTARQDERPDFDVCIGDAIVGLDCTAFTVEKRRNAQALFVGLRQRILQVEPNMFTNLAGYMVYLWFPGEAGIDLPFRGGDAAAIEELLQALVGYRPDPQLSVVPAGEMRDTAPDLGIVTTPSGAAFYGVPHLNALPDTPFAAITGFELGLAYTTEHSSSSAWAELSRLIDNHDKPGVDWLLVSAGAPNQYGQTFLTEELVARFLVDHPVPVSPPETIRRITLHFWSTCEAHEIYPFKEGAVFGPLHAGVVPPHRPMLPGPQPDDTDVTGDGDGSL